MDEDRDEEVLDVLRDDIGAAVEKRPGTRRALEREASSNRAPDDDRVLLTGRPHELDQPAMEDTVDVHLLCGVAELMDVRQRHDRLETLERMREALLLEDAQLVLDTGIAERGAQEEPVELGFRAAGTCPRTRWDSPSR